MEENKKRYPTFHLLKKQLFQYEFFIKDAKYDKPEYQNHFRFGYLTNFIYVSKKSSQQTFYMQGQILKLILFKKEDFEKALESKFSWSRLNSSDYEPVNHIGSLNNHQLDQLDILKNRLNEEDCWIKDLLKKGLVFNKFYNQFPNSEKFSEYQLEFQQLYFSRQDPYQEERLKIDDAFLAFETIRNFECLEDLAGIVKLQKVGNGQGNQENKIEEELLYFYLIIEPFFEPLKSIKSVQDFKENFLKESIQKVKVKNVSNIYRSLFHSEILNFDHTIYND